MTDQGAPPPPLLKVCGTCLWGSKAHRDSRRVRCPHVRLKVAGRPMVMDINDPCRAEPKRWRGYR